MKKRGFLAAILLVFLSEAAVVAIFMERNRETPQDVVAANKIVKTLEQNWDALAGNGQGEPQAGSSMEVWEGISKGAGEGFQITVLDCDGKVLLKTKEHLSETISQAVSHRDTILFSCHLQRALRLNSQPFSCQICHAPGSNVKISMHGHITDIRLNKLYNSPANIIPVIDLF